MKRFLCALLSSVVLFSFTACGSTDSSTSAQEITEQETTAVETTATAKEVGVEYTSGEYEYVLLDNGTVEIIRHIGPAFELEIPSTLDGYTVTSIGDSVFANYGIENAYDNFTSVKIPNSITKIGASAFCGCASLNITIPSSVTSIGSNAFDETAWYDSQPDGVVYVNEIAYGYKGDMPANTSITLKDGTKSILDFAFNGFTNLASITVPKSVTTIGEYSLGYTKSNGFYEEVKTDGFTIYGSSGSAAETYATENDFTFVAQ